MVQFAEYSIDDLMRMDTEDIKKIKQAAFGYWEICNAVILIKERENNAE